MPTRPGLAARSKQQATIVEQLEDRFFDLPTGSWDVGPTRALVLPLPASAGGRPYGFQVFGLNRFRPFDEGYRDFCDLVAAQIAASLTDARAYEFERSRAETLAQLDQAKTDFFTNVSHEFRTPLTLLLGPAEDAINDESAPLEGRQRDRVEVILRNGQRLLKLVNTLPTLPAGVRSRRGAVRAGRPRAVHPRAGQHVRDRRRASGPEAEPGRGTALAARVRRPRPVGQGRAQPAVERPEVHLPRCDRPSTPAIQRPSPPRWRTFRPPRMPSERS